MHECIKLQQPVGAGHTPQVHMHIEYLSQLMEGIHHQCEVQKVRTNISANKSGMQQVVLIAASVTPIKHTHASPDLVSVVVYM